MGLVPSRLCCTVASVLGVLLASPPATAAQPNLIDLSLEELGNVLITSASKREQRLADAPASVFVITADDIRRSGARSLPDALRLAPNLQVARVSATSFAISGRGFNGNSANKLLVLIDGRSVYAPLFAGVFWDVQNLLLEDVERIEVISGPGSTLWGVNAVNGVINVITRSASQTPGVLLSGGAGNTERQAAMRLGAAAPGGADIRFYAKREDRRHTETGSGAFVDDAAHTTLAGFRADWGHDSRFTLLGNAYQGHRGQPLPGSISVSGVAFELGTIRVSGANLLARWERRLQDGELSVQGYLDRTVRDVPPTFDETLNVVDLATQYSSRLFGAHTVVLGANYRYARDRVDSSTPFFAFLPARKGLSWASLFAQDEVRLGEDWQLTLGARAERNNYTGLEFLPNLRLAWKPAPSQLWWLSAARTVRAPSRLDRDTYIPARPPFLLGGGPNFRAETADVLELGYRGQPAESVSLSVTAFHAEYAHLRTQELAPSRTAVFFGNGMRGKVRGLEAWGSLQATSFLRLHGGITLLWPKLRLAQGSVDTALSVASTEGAMPRRQSVFRASLNLPGDNELDVMLRHVSALSAPEVDAYTAVDLRWGWQMSADTELSVTASNLVDRDHGEFTSATTRSSFGRSLFLHVRTRF